MASKFSHMLALDPERAKKDLIANIASLRTVDALARHYEVRPLTVRRWARTLAIPLECDDCRASLRPGIVQFLARERARLVPEHVDEAWIAEQFARDRRQIRSNAKNAWEIYRTTLLEEIDRKKKGA